MLNSVSKTLSRINAIRNSVRVVPAEKAINPFDVPDAAAGLMGLTGGSGNRARYALYRGHVYSAVHALACEAAGQPFNMGFIHQEGSTGAMPLAVKTWKPLPKFVTAKGSREELQIVAEHEFLTSLETPNNVQQCWQFVYSFVANLCLTGWGWVVGGPVEGGGFEFYSIPSTWVKPIHEDGPFSAIKLVNPRDAASESNAPLLSRGQFAFAYLPNPGDPLSALAPAAAQMSAIKIDERIQTSQELFFENGVFPSVIVTVGSNPHPDAKVGMSGRPRLNAGQRRQVIGAIRKVMGGVSNYGNPAIVDGMIEKIERLSAKQNEIGWEKSEKSIRSRILAAFGVHPFVLGEEMPGSYAQAFVVRELFCKRVNTLLNMLGQMMTEFSRELTNKKFIVWWDECEAKDPQIEQREWAEARKRNDVSQNQFLAHRLGLPPDEDRNESVIARESAVAVTSIASLVTAGKLTPEQGVSLLESLGLPSDRAVSIAGTGNPMEDEEENEQDEDSQEEQDEEEDEQEEQEQEDEETTQNSQQEAGR